MNIQNTKIAFGLTSSFYAFNSVINEIKKIKLENCNIIPIMSYDAYYTDSKFGKARDFIKNIEEITNKKVICDVEEAEDVEADIMIIAPCSRKYYSKASYINF